MRSRSGLCAVPAFASSKVESCSNIFASTSLRPPLVLLTNADAIVKQRGGGSRKEWPYSCTLEENFKDLAWLEVCAAYKQLFCYVLRDKKGTYVGAVYIYPIDLFYATQNKDYDGDFSFWITGQAYRQGQYEAIFRLLLDWLRTDWPFKPGRIYLRNTEIPAGITAA
jgi:hypothetical protein